MKQVILVFGESTNDTRSISGLARILDARLATYDLFPRRDPVVHLRMEDLPKTRRSTADSIARVVRADAVRRAVVAVIAHQDADAVEPSHEPIADNIEHELCREHVPQPVAAVPAWELEAWLMLFPEALRATRNCWKTVNLHGRSTGSIFNAKEVLRRLLRPSTGRCPDYAESDSETIVNNINVQEINLSSILRRSSSLNRFRDKLVELRLD